MGRIGCLETVGTCSVSLIWQGKGQVQGHGRFLRILRAKNGSIPKLRNGNILILSGTRFGLVLRGFGGDAAGAKRSREYF